MAAAGVDIQLLSSQESEDAALVQQVTDLVGDVYRVAEDGMWIDGAVRTTVADVTRMIRARELAVARLDGRIAGAVQIQRLDATTGGFGMLAAHPAHRGLGIGRGLMAFAERTSRDAGLGSMQLELLVPRDWTHPVKVFLAAWYARSGYALVRTGTIEQAYPHLAPLLATPCDLQIHRKELAGAPGA